MYESKTTEKQEQYDWRAEKNLDGCRNGRKVILMLKLLWSSIVPNFFAA